MFLSNSLYDKLKWVVQYLLPGLGTLYFALAAIWDLPNTEQVVGTLSALAVFLGTLLGLSSMNYNKAMEKEGVLTSTVMDESKLYPVTNNFILTEKSHQVIKWVVMILLPASGAFYYALSNLWSLPYTKEVVGTITAITSFAGLLLGYSTKQYNKTVDGSLSQK